MYRNIQIKKLIPVLGGVVLTCIFSACSTYQEKPTRWHTPPDQWNQPRIYHTAFDEKFADRIVTYRGFWPEHEVETVLSSNKAYRYMIQRPDYTKEGPWSTQIYIDNERGFPHVILIKDHNHWDVHVNWLNEKLIYVSVWWGRIVGTYFVYDVELEKIVVKEMMHDGSIAYRQYQQNK